MTASERWQRIWRVVGITVAVVVALAGLAMVAAFVLFAIAMNSWGSNK